MTANAVHAHILPWYSWESALAEIRPDTLGFSELSFPSTSLQAGMAWPSSSATSGLSSLAGRLVGASSWLLEFEAAFLRLGKYHGPLLGVGGCWILDMTDLQGDCLVGVFQLYIRLLSSARRT